MYGYKIVNGTAVVDEQEAAVVINIFNGYISGMSLRDAAINAGKPMVHSMVKRIIRNFCYVGDDFYPAILSRQTFSKANAELIRRAEKHGSSRQQSTRSSFSQSLQNNMMIRLHRQNIITA